MKNFFRTLRAYTRHYWHSLLVWLRFDQQLAKSAPQSLPSELIVSLTSFPPRFASLHLTLKCLLAQSVKADRVILWLYEKDMGQLPDTVRALQSRGLTIAPVEKDLKSYKKLLPALEAYPGAFIVTADDDLFYKHRWLQELVEAYRESDKVILGQRGHLMRLDADGAPLPYRQWDRGTRSREASAHILLTGAGGILYPPQCFDAELFDEARYTELCPNADDVWFYFMLRKRGYRFKSIGGGFKVRNWVGSQKFALFRDNLGGGGNDEVIKKMCAAYPGLIGPD